eukprot:31510-Pelagococcus_subviridis.AAC.27
MPYPPWFRAFMFAACICAISACRSIAPARESRARPSRTGCRPAAGLRVASAGGAGRRFSSVDAKRRDAVDGSAPAATTGGRTNDEIGGTRGRA